MKYDSVDGTAISPTDYGAVHGTLNWAAGDGTNKSIAIAIVANSVATTNKTFTVSLSAPTGATLGGTAIETVTIQKN